MGALLMLAVAVGLLGLGVGSGAQHQVEAPPDNIDPPSISGTAGVGQILAADLGLWETYDVPTTFSYQWQRGSSDIAGATSSTYTVLAGDTGSTLFCLVTAESEYGVVSERSNGIAIPLKAITNVTAPVASGTGNVGQTLSASTGVWDRDANAGNVSYAYQWQRAGSAISGATSSTYTLVSADDGKSVRCEVTATDNSGSASAVSNAISVSTPNASISYNNRYVSVTGSASQSISVALGTASAARTVIVVLTMVGSAQASSLAIGGVAGTLRHRTTNGNAPVEIWTVPITSGTSGPLTFTVTSGAVCCAAVYSAYNLQSAVPVGTGSGTSLAGYSASITSQAGGVIVAGALTGFFNNTAQATTYGGVLSRDHTDTLTNPTRVSAAHAATSGSSSSVSCSFGNADSIATVAVAAFR